MSSDLSEKFHDTLEQVGEFSRTAGKKLQGARRGTAEVLKGSAASIRDCAGAIDSLAHRTASSLEATSNYVRKHDVRRIKADLRQLIRTNPGGFMIGAAAIGFLCGLSLRRSGRRA